MPPCNTICTVPKPPAPCSRSMYRPIRSTNSGCRKKPSAFAPMPVGSNPGMSGLRTNIGPSDMVPTRIGAKRSVIEPYGQRLERVEQEPFVALGFAARVEVDVVQSIQQAFERGHHLLPRERR